MKIYEALKEMVENGKTIRRNKGHYDGSLYKKIEVPEVGSQILQINPERNRTELGLFLSTEDIFMEWEIHEEKKEK